MKAVIIAFNNIIYSPYIKTYSNFLDKKNICYDVILPDRNNIDEALGENLYRIKWNPKKGKISNSLFFRKEVLKILKRNKYDFIFVLTTMPAVLLSSYLIRKYKNRYLVDVRDYTQENLKPYYWIECGVIKNAAMRVISSKGFENFLPEADYFLSHNLSQDYASPKEVFDKNTDGKIRIGYVGSISYVEHCKHVIDLVAKDERFTFHFYGRESEKKEISTYIDTLGCERIKYFGKYVPQEKESIINSVDLLFNVYGNETPLVKYAISNKFYDSFFYKKPLLTSPGTYMSTQAGDYSFDIDYNTANLDALYDWYNSLDGEKMVNFMNSTFEEFAKDTYRFEEELNKILF